jgi:hypothetical protein
MVPSQQLFVGSHTMTFPNGEVAGLDFSDFAKMIDLIEAIPDATASDKRFLRRLVNAALAHIMTEQWNKIANGHSKTDYEEDHARGIEVENAVIGDLERVDWIMQSGMQFNEVNGTPSTGKIAAEYRIPSTSNPNLLRDSRTGRPTMRVLIELTNGTTTGIDVQRLPQRKQSSPLSA